MLYFIRDLSRSERHIALGSATAVAPVKSNVQISGMAEDGYELTGYYGYSGADSDAENVGATTFR